MPASNPKKKKKFLAHLPPSQHRHTQPFLLQPLLSHLSVQLSVFQNANCLLLLFVHIYCMKKNDINIYLLLFTPGPCWLQSCSLMPFCIIYIILVCVSTSTTLCGSGACCFLFFPPSSVCYSSSLLNECVQQHSSVVKPQSERTVTKKPYLVFQLHLRWTTPF